MHRIATFTLGYSHPIEFYLPDGVDLRVDKPAANLTPLVLTGSDKQIVGQRSVVGSRPLRTASAT